MNDYERGSVIQITGGPASLIFNNRPILTFTPEGEVVFGEGVEPSEAAREFWTFLAHMNPLRGTVRKLEAENAAMREIVPAFAGKFTPPYTLDPCPWCYADQEYEEHAPDCIVTKARAILAEKEVAE